MPPVAWRPPCLFSYRLRRYREVSVPFHAGYVVRHCPSSKEEEEEVSDQGKDVVEDKLGSTTMVEKVVGRGGVTAELVAGVVVADADSVTDGVVGSALGVVLSTTDVVLEVVSGVVVVDVSDVDVDVDVDVDSISVVEAVEVSVGVT